MTGSLAVLLAQATPGPWRWATDEDEDGILYAEAGIGDQVFATYPDTARLIALCPDAVALLCDWFEKYNQHMDNEDIRRFVSLEERAR